MAAFRHESNGLVAQVFYPCHGEWIDLTISACRDHMKRALELIEKDLVNVACKWQETDDVNRKWYRQVLQKARSRGKSGGKTPRTPGNRYFLLNISRCCLLLLVITLEVLNMPVI